MLKTRILSFALLWLAIGSFPQILADERRASAPTFTPNQTRGVFFDDLSQAFRGSRPTVSGIRKTAKTAIAASATNTPKAAQVAESTWTGLISASSLEDEVKRLKLVFDASVTTPGAFNSGGYQDARLHLSVLASLFAVINEHGSEVRWKSQAAAARDLIARTAFNCKAGSTQVYNEAKLRKGDLQDLIAGSGLASKAAEAQNDWSMIADRSPLMEYAEALIDSLEDATRDAAAIKKDTDLVKRNAELIAVLGEILTQEGMDEADDGDYTKLSRDMVGDSSELVRLLERGDAAEIRKGTAMIRKRCDACHEQYR